MALVGSSVGLAYVSIMVSRSNPFLKVSIRSAGGAVFSGQLRSQLRIFAPDLPSETQTIVLESVKAVLSLPDTIKGPVTHAYINAIDRVFIAGTASSALAAVAALLIRRDKISLQATHGISS